MEYILEVDKLRKSFPGFALKDIDIKLPKGYVLGFIGPNGAGKTTTIKLIMNLLRADQGEVKIFGLDHTTYEQDIKERIGFVYDENYYYEEMTPLELKRVIGTFYRDWDDKVFHTYLSDFKLPLSKPLKNFSKGMKTKLSLAFALSHRAELLIMDEPTSGLDPVFRSEILDVLRDFMSDENKGILFSSHVTSDLDKIADYVCFINEGEIVLNCSKEELLEQYAVVKGERKVLNEELRRELVGLRVSDFGFSGLTCRAPLIRTLVKDSVIIERPTLEDIMLYTVRREERV